MVRLETILMDDAFDTCSRSVRNRSRELVEMLSDVEKIRAERRKAKLNKNKYTGVGSDGTGMSFESSGGGRYGGFGNDSFGGGSSSYGNGTIRELLLSIELISLRLTDYSGGGGSTSRGGGSGGFSDSRRQFEEYNAGDDEVSSTPVRSNSVRTPIRKATAPPPQAPAPAVDLLGGFDDDDFSTPAPAPAATPAINKALPAVSTKPTASLDGMSL